MKVVLSTLNAKYIHSSLALYSLAQAGKKEDRDLVVREYSVNNQLLEVLADLYGEAPAVLGLACYIWNIDMILALAGMVKKVLPLTVIVLGGPEAGAAPEEILLKQPGVDAVVLGEGEQIWAELLDALDRRESLAIVPGLAIRSGQEVAFTGSPGIIASLDSLEFAYSDQDMTRLKDKIIYYESSRGCPFFCQYCLSGNTGKVRCRSLASVYRELAFFIRHQVKQVKFVDRTFNANKKHYFPIMRFLADQKCQTNFHFEMSADLLDEEVLVFLAQVPAGRFQFEIGVQSTAPATLQALQRRNDWQKIVSNVKTVRNYDNIHLHLDLIVGLPYETWDDFERSFNDVYSLRPHMLQIGFLKLLKGSGIRRKAQQYGYIAMEDAPYEVLGHAALSYKEIRRLKQMEEVFNQVYNSGYLPRTLKFLIQLRQNNAFQFFISLAEYWEAANLFLAAHSPKNILHHMLHYVAAHHPEYLALTQELMKFDVLMDGRGGRPEFLPWNESLLDSEDAGTTKSDTSNRWLEAKNDFWRSGDIVKKYVPDFRFSSWRDLHKRYHIEVFSVDIPRWTESGSECLQPEIVPVLFVKACGGNTFQMIAAGDFFGEKGN